MGNLKYFIEENVELSNKIKAMLKRLGKTQSELSIHLKMSNVRLNKFLTNRERLPAVVYIKILKYFRHVRECNTKENS